MKVYVPANLKGKDLWCESGKIHLDENMSKEEVEAAQKIYPQIKVLEAVEKPKRRKSK
jgi:hypothetical protein